MENRFASSISIAVKVRGLGWVMSILSREGWKVFLPLAEQSNYFIPVLQVTNSIKGLPVEAALSHQRAHKVIVQLGCQVTETEQAKQSWHA